MPPGSAARPLGTGFGRYRRLFELFRNEREEPAPFYRALAAELAADLDRRHGLRGARLLDLGCGPGWYTEAAAARGAQVTPVEVDRAELSSFDGPPPDPALGSAEHLPFADASFDGLLCSNMLEHTPDTLGVFDEMARVVRPGGWLYVSWTNWYSPWGGHDMSPWHLLGPERGSRLYEKRYGPPRKNRYGEGLFAVHIGSTLDLVRSHPQLELLGAEPRYWPALRGIMGVPGVREVLAWNCVLHLRRV